MTDIIAFARKYNLDNWTLSSVITNIQNVALLLLSTSVLGCITYYNYLNIFTDNKTMPYEMFESIIPYVGLHAFIDFFIVKGNDLRLHHLFILGTLFYNSFYEVSREDKFPVVYCLLKTEISSIFYVLKYWLPKNSMLYNINNLMFYLGFLKFRVIDFYTEVIQSNYMFDTILSKYSTKNVLISALLIFSIYGLYILNLYWFTIINKIIYKQISNFFLIDQDLLCHFICKYIHFLNIPLAISIYSFDNRNQLCLLDLAGIIGLSITSNTYHEDIYQRLVTKNIVSYTHPTKDNLVYLLDDTLMIHLRSFLTTLACYYYSPHLMLVLTYSLIFHCVSIYQLFLNILSFYVVTEDSEAVDKKYFFQIHNASVIVSIGVDIFLVQLNSGIETRIPLLLVSILIAILFMMEPFYKQTHVAFHILLIAQTYYLCMSVKGAV